MQQPPSEPSAPQNAPQVPPAPAADDRYGALRRTITKPVVARKFPSANSPALYPVSSTPSEPDMEETIKCVCTQIHTLLRHSCKHPKANPKVIPIFCEDLKTLDVQDMNQLPVPEISHMQIFMTYILQQLNMNAQCCIICLIYVERLITDAQVVLHPINWRRLVVISLLMASKIWEDHGLQNIAIVRRAFPFFSVREINSMEMAFLDLLHYNLVVTSKEYVEYYFSLRDLGGGDSFPLKQLERDELDRLESRSQARSESYREKFRSLDVTSQARGAAGEDTHRHRHRHLLPAPSGGATATASAPRPVQRAAAAALPFGCSPIPSPHPDAAFVDGPSVEGLAEALPGGEEEYDEEGSESDGFDPNLPPR
ncbi:putative amine-terminal domain cyclin [Paratrimastix pyriformis]|uniref:Amine-terminal domain cyclin n=1 Tax=Paratrimastix pyriformis TaxID=342808 RepID=A0ABQ8UQ95_9EUKA|nr:putative amine-terminal domain cyclin [Paratrimastix pyriformis]